MFRLPRFAGLAVGFALALVAPVLRAEIYEIFPSDANQTCDEEFENLANDLLPGDELILHGGIYTQSCRRAITVNGTPEEPIVIRAAAGERPVLTRPADNIDLHNNIEIEDSSWVTFRGLTFQGGSIGVRFIRGSNIRFVGNEIHETGANALSMNSGDCDAFTLRRNHIHDTGLSTSGPTEGEGMYIGCNNDTCRTTNSVIEGNYIHHLTATSGGGNDGIEVKPGSHGNIVRHNVIHDTNIGTEYPCIFVYGGGDGQNIVDGNLLWNCGEAIQVVSDAVVRNNLILSSSIHGITAAPHAQVSGIKDVEIVNNTIFGHPKCLYVRWSGATGVTLANNAVYCGGDTAVDGSGLSGPEVTVSANYVEGALSGVSIDDKAFFDGGAAAAAFVDPERGDFWPAPGSPLIGAADALEAALRDFNARLRVAPADVGAYESDGVAANPCWQPEAGFKQPCSQPIAVEGDSRTTAPTISSFSTAARAPTPRSGTTTSPPIPGRPTPGRTPR